MKYFYDTEFLEDGMTIELISIGIVAEDGREYYAINADMPYDRIAKDDWLMENVVANLGPQRGFRTMKSVIRDDVASFLRSDDEDVELWADYAAYDHVVLAQLFGKMIDLPPWVPMFTHDFQQELRRLGNPAIPAQPDGLHNALADARHLKACFESVAFDD
jgi:hypothetical protein